MYASLNGLESHMGAEAFAIWREGRPNAQGELDSCEARLLAAILPARPAWAPGAFEKAVYAQIVHEAARAELDDMPEGLSSFSVNGFSASIDPTGDASSRHGLGREARALLLAAGLLYRGVPC